MENETKHDDTDAGIESSGKGKETGCCDPECDCHKPKSGGKIRIIAGILILVLAVSLFAYKLAKPGPGAKNTDSADYPAVNTAPETVSDPLKQQKEADAQSARLTGKTQVGEYLDSFASLNTVAVNQDAVLVLVRGKENESIEKGIETAMLGAQNTLKTKGVNAGVYTLRTSAPEYKDIIRQISPPSIVVACKGRGMNAIPGSGVNETKLLQAFVAVSQAGGCCPSGSAGGAPCK